MLSIKLTPFILFLIILIVLVISVIFGNRFMNKEGFIAFAGDKQPIEKVSIPQYSANRPIYKLEDNLYFDQTTGDLIEIEGAPFNSENYYDYDGVSIKNILITDRDTSKTDVYACNSDLTCKITVDGKDKIIPADTDKNTGVISKSSSSWLYKSQSDNTTDTNTLYIPWDNDTYIVVFSKDVTKGWGLTNMFYFNDDTGYFDNTNKTDTKFITNVPTQDNDPTNNSLMTENLYDTSKKVYQLSKNVRFDIQNGNLIINSVATGGITVYDRRQNVVSRHAAYVGNVDFKPWWVVDTDGQLIVIYIPNGTNTIICLVSYDAKKEALTIVNIKKFTNDGLYLDAKSSGDTSNAVGSASGTGASAAGTCASAAGTGASAAAGTGASAAGTGASAAGTGASAAGSGTNIPSNQPDSVISEYFKWYWYWKSSASATDSNSDYILKTQIVPPVCPSCPACSTGNCSGSTCSNCGGQGGSGTLSSSGVSLFDANGNPTTCEKLGANNFGYDASKNKVYCYNNTTSKTSASGSTSNNTNNAVSGLTYNNSSGGSNLNNNQNNVGGVFNNAVDEIGGTANKLIDTTGSIVSGVVNTTGGVLNTAANDITGIFKPSGNYGGVSSAQPGSQNIIGSEPQGINQRSSYYGTQNQPADQYNYYGQLPTRGSSSYIPITADFSAFGK